MNFSSVNWLAVVVCVVLNVGAGFMIWLGFVATTNLVNNLFAGRGFKV